MIYALFGAVWLFFVAVLSLAMRVVEGRERNVRLVAAEIESSRLYSAAMAERVEQLRRYRHDAYGLLYAIESALGGADGAQGAPSPTEDVAKSGADASLARAVIGFQEQKCVLADVAFTCSVEPGCLDGALGGGVDEGEICAVLQNLLENAYEASMRVKDASARFVSLSIERCGSGDGRHVGSGDGKGRLLRIAVSNRVDPEEDVSFQTGKPDPELHGLGLRIVGDVASRYAGSFSIDVDECAHVVEAVVVL